MQNAKNYAVCSHKQENTESTSQVPAGPGIPGHCPGYFESCLLISRGPDARRPYIAYACLCMHRRTSSVQCSDKVRFPQLRIKCGIAKSYPGTHTALQAPMVYIMGQLAANQMIKCYNNSITTCLIYLVAYTIKGKKERLCECRSLQ